MTLLLARSLLAPVLVAGCSFAAWRWGRTIGGLLLGLPLISGPVSALLFLQHGAGFAERAAQGALLGMVATGAFCLGYVVLGTRLRWWLAAIIAGLACIGAAWTLTLVHLSVPLEIGLVSVCLALISIVLLRAPANPVPVPRPAALSLMAKMVVAGVVVFAITEAAGFVGPQIAGLLAPLPVLLSMMTATAHRRAGHEAACGVVRGAVAGVWGGAAFFSVVAVALTTVSPALAYAGALAAALLGSLAAFRIQTARAGRSGTHARSLRAALTRPRHLPTGVLRRVLHPAFLSALRG